MARKSEIVIVPQDWGGRDAGKHFLITEWPSDKALKWGIKAMLAYNRGAGEMPVHDILGTGWEGIFFIGVQTFLRGTMQAEEVIPLLDELMECVKIIRDPGSNDVATGKPVTHAILADDIQEPKTQAWLRSEVLRLHTNFSPAEILSKLISAIMTVKPSSRRRTSQS